MKEPDLLQEQRLSLRQFRRAVAERTETERTVATKRAADQAAAKAAFNDAQQQAKTLWEKASRCIQSAQETLGRVRLQEFLPKDIPAAALTFQPGGGPDNQLGMAVVEVEQSLSRIRDDVTALEQWRQRKQTQKQVLAVAAIVILLISAVALYNGYHAWETHQRYQAALTALESGQYAEASRLFNELGDYKDSQTLLQESDYQLAVAALNTGAWEEASRLFNELGDYKDSLELAFVALCPSPVSPGDTCTRRTDGVVMVYIPGGSFLMGSDPVQDAWAEGDAMPQHRVTLDSFWIDRTEVTNAQYEMCVAAGACASSRYASDGDHNGATYPVVGVSWRDAVAYCAWAGGQLPTEAQWEYAARGPESFLYPWGNNPPTCSLAQFGGCANNIMPVGSLSPDGDSWVGAADMAGSVGEWVADWYDSGYYAVSPSDNPTGPASGDAKVLRGGSWASYGDAYRDTVRASDRNLNAPTNRDGLIGFRCAQE